MPARRGCERLRLFPPSTTDLDLSGALALGQVEFFCARAGITAIVGVDEAGRGPLAGPVTAAAFLLPLDEDSLALLPKTLNDSKAMRPSARLEAYHKLLASPLAYAIAAATPQEIDACNIRNATVLAMHRAVTALVRSRPAAGDCPVLVDGDLTLPVDNPQAALVRGDGRSLAIAAASVLAKEYRDSLMQTLDLWYPGYGLAGHKGYPCPAHKDAIAVLGVSPVHRKSFRHAR